MNTVELLHILQDEYISTKELYEGINGDCVSYDYLRGMKKMVVIASAYIDEYLEKEAKSVSLEEAIGRTD